MERMTHRYVGGTAWASIYKVSACGENECKGPIIDRLAAYEVTGLMPEEVADLQRAWDMYGGEEGITAAFQKAAERDAAVEELHGICWCCAHGKKWDKAPALSKMTTCEYMPIQVSGALARGGGKCRCPHWEWRGLQRKDEVHETN